MSDLEEEVQLSRLIITGPLDQNTPICVITEILGCHGINYTKSYLSSVEYIQNAITTIISKPVPEIIPPYGRKNLSQIALFINDDPNCSWTRNSLVRALNFIRKFMTGDRRVFENPLLAIPDIFNVGNQTPREANNINACILYRTCRYYEITTNRNTTTDTMANAIVFLRESQRQLAKRMRNFLSRANKKDLVNHLLLAEIQERIDSEPEPMEIIQITSEGLERCRNKYSDIESLRKTITPLTAEEAIALSAICYKKDISMAENPVSEYQSLRGSPVYVPIDSRINRIFQINKHLIDLEKTFNPLFPTSFYGESLLFDMAIREGYPRHDIHNVSAYELLQVSYLSTTFYEGNQPEVKNQKTVIFFEDVSDIKEKDTLISYGIRNDNMIIFTYYELTQLLIRNRNFNEYDNKGVFSPLAISKLKYICSHAPGNNEATWMKKELAVEITRVEIYLSDNDNITRMFIELYENSTDEVKMKFRETIDCLMRMALFMRGWSGEGQKPIAIAPVDDQDEVERKSNEEIHRFETLCDSFQHGKLVKSLPLYRYRNRTFEASVLHGEGLTIEGRINIVKEGKEVNSCIRLSSNWFAVTAYFYMNLLKMDPGFNVNDMADIS